ncbi:MAG: DUF4230 domain-containing protein [Treponema sp.]|nr:DUF4230 domain-containing protein [Treponema sp.]
MNQKKSGGGFAASLATKVVLRVVTIVLVAAAAFLFAAFAFNKLQKVRVQNKRAAVERELAECAELVLYKMRYSDIITIKKRGAIAKAFTIVRYSGVLRAGIENIRDCQIEISSNGKDLRVLIPPTVLLGNDIQSQEVFDEQQRLFTRISAQEIFDQIDAAKQEAADEILAQGLLDDADARAKQVISSLLRPLGFSTVTVELK